MLQQYKLVVLNALKLFAFPVLEGCAGDYFIVELAKLCSVSPSLAAAIVALVDWLIS